MFILTANKKRLIDVDRLTQILFRYHTDERMMVVGIGYQDDPEVIIGFYDNEADAIATIEEIADALAKDQRVVKLTRNAIA